jgi:hypothetical protein
MKHPVSLALLLCFSLMLSCESEIPVSSSFTKNGQKYCIDTLREDTIPTEKVIENFSARQEFSQNELHGKINPLTKLCGNIPSKMKDLDGGIKKYFYKITQKDKLDLNIFGYAGAELGKKDVLIIVDFVQYKELDCTDKKRTFGVGARLFLHIREVRHGINFTKLPQLAANVELGRVSVTYTLSTIGLTGDKILDALPQGSDFTVENYAKVMNAIDQIIRLAKDDTKGVVIAPQLLPEISAKE